MPDIREPDVFERKYPRKLDASLAPHELLIHYKPDRAPLDLGLQACDRGSSEKRRLGDVPV